MIAAGCSARRTAGDATGSVGTTSFGKLVNPSSNKPQINGLVNVKEAELCLQFSPDTLQHLVVADIVVNLTTDGLLAVVAEETNPRHSLLNNGLPNRPDLVALWLNQKVDRSQRGKRR